MKSRLVTLLWTNHLLPEEEITKTVKIFQGRKQRTIEKHLIVKAFINVCLEESSDVITPKEEVFKVFQHFCRTTGLTNPLYKFPTIAINGLTLFLAIYMKFSENRTWRHGRQVRAFKGIKIRGQT